MSEKPTVYLHACEGKLPEGGYGQAIEYCYEEEGKGMWVGNGEYGSQVNYCPYCGKKAEMQTKVKGENKYE